MGFSQKVNYFDLGKDLDFVTHDQYPGGFYLPMPIDDEAKSAMTLDVIRSFKNKNYWIMEQQSGPTGWEILGRTPAPGQLALWAMKSVAHGGDNVIFFRWRTCTVGTEQYWHGILPHNGKPGRRYYELKSMIEKFAPLMDKIQDTPSNAKVAIVYSYEQYFALDIQPHHPNLSYVDVLLDFYRAFYDMNIPVDLISDYYNDGNLNTDLSKYSLVICPLQYIETKEKADIYRDYVKNGGNMIFTYRNGVKDCNNICQTENELPGMLYDVLGVEVNDYDCLRDTSVKVEFDYFLGDGNLWSDIITPTTAQVLGKYQSEYYKGQAAITEHNYGKGRAFYVGTQLDNNLMNKLSLYICSKCNINTEFKNIEKGIEVMSRMANDKEYIFFMNHNNHEVRLPNDKIADLEEEVVNKRGVLLPYEVAVYVRKFE